MDARALGLLIVTLGVGAVIVGGLVATGALSWFGRLPGDFRYEGGRSRVFVPVTSMIILSVVLTLVVNLILTLLRR